jgi:putative flippase GtrA
VIETTEIHDGETAEIPNPDQSFSNKQGTGAHRITLRARLLRQVLRFGLVGGLNTLVDLLILNGLLLLFPTTSTPILLAYNSLAFSMGAVNSFLLNKYWTFGFRQRTTRRELVRFTLTTLCGIGWSTLILWLASRVLHPFLVNTTMWANASKVFAIAGTALISYLGMYLWVFVSKAQKEQTLSHTTVSAHRTASGERRSLPAGQRRDVSYKREQVHENGNGNGDKIASSHSLSVILPAYNEEQVIASTIADVLDVLSAWRMDVEVLVVNDGSMDRTGAIVAALADAHPRVRLITHPINQGYGAALVSGFVAATKELTFFMDADGQFDIRDLQQFFPFIDEYNAVIGYRLDRQDSWMRKLNAWGWKRLIGWVLGVHVRDIDCAFKLLHTEFLHQYPLETRGAMINAELLYRLTQAGYSYREIGVHHHPRQGGRATGAKLSVILRAMRELFVYARKWHRESREHSISGIKHKLRSRSRAR